MELRSVECTQGGKRQNNTAWEQQYPLLRFNHYRP